MTGARRKKGKGLWAAVASSLAVALAVGGYAFSGWGIVPVFAADADTVPIEVCGIPAAGTVVVGGRRDTTNALDKIEVDGSKPCVAVPEPFNNVGQTLQVNFSKFAADPGNGITSKCKIPAAGSFQPDFKVRCMLPLDGLLIEGDPVPAKDTVERISKYAALGDSYSSGHGASSPGRYLDDDCKISADAYSHVFFKMLRGVKRPGVSEELAWTMGNFACTGAKIPQISEQVSKVPADTHIVTLTAGGNDLGFGGTIAACAISSGADCAGRLNRIKPTVVKQPLIDLMVKIHERAKGADIVLSAYPRIFETGACGFFAIAEENRDKIRSLQSSLMEVDKGAVAEANKKIGGKVVKFANADASFTNHRVCAKDAWMNGAGGHDGDPLASYHPNDKGHVAMGTAVFDTVIGGTPFSR